MNNFVKVLCKSGEALQENSVQVKLSSEYSMKLPPTGKYSIENVWKEKLKKNVRLFDASKFRLYGMKENYEDVDNLPATITFLIGITSYKEFIGTNFAPYAEQLVNEGISEFGDSQAYMADPLGVGSLLETCDQKLVFIKRSHTCAEMQGMVDRPGGHPEPEEILKNSNNSFEDVDSSLITQEIFSSVLKEIRDEVNIPIKNLSSPLLLGIFYNPETFKRPSLEFYVSCDLSSAVVHEMYSKQTQAESYESTELIIIPLSEVLKIGKSKDGDFWKMLTPTAQCALELLCIYHS